MSPSITKIIIKSSITLVSAILIFYFLIIPKIDEIAKNQTSLEDIGSQLTIAQSEVQQLKKIEKDKEGLTKTKEIVENYLPDKGEASSFIVTLEHTSSEIPVIINSLSVAESKATTTSKSTSDSSNAENKTGTTNPAKAPEKSLDFSATLVSTQDNIITFLQRMENLNRFNTIESFSLGGYSADKGTLSLRIEGKAYYGK
jgi:Tfp pilus assembly protein PilO